MVENGCGFDVASKKELDQVLKYNINKENIVFANPCKHRTALVVLKLLE